MTQPVLELTGATVIKADRPVLHDLSLKISVGEHTAIVGPNGAGKSVLVRLLTHEDRAVAPAGGSSPVRVFGDDNWNVFELRSQLGIVSADLHQRFVAGNSEGRIRAEAAVLSGFLASDGILRYGTVTDDMRRRAAEALASAGCGASREAMAGRALERRSATSAARSRARDRASRARPRRAHDRTRPCRAPRVHGACPADRARRDDDHPHHASHRRNRAGDRARHSVARWDESPPTA